MFLFPLLHLQIEPFRGWSQSSLFTSAATLGCMLQPTGEFVFRSPLKRDPLGGGDGVIIAMMPWCNECWNLTLSDFFFLYIISIFMENSFPPIQKMCLLVVQVSIPIVSWCRKILESWHCQPFFSPTGDYTSVITHGLSYCSFYKVLWDPIIKNNCITLLAIQTSDFNLRGYKYKVHACKYCPTQHHCKKDNCSSSSIVVL